MIRWSNNDKRFGPFIFANDCYSKWGIILDSGDNDDCPDCNFRIYLGKITFVIELPKIVKPQISWVDTSQYEWSSKNGGYNKTHNKEYGIQLSEGFLQLFYGIQSDDSSEERKYKSWFLPWTQWQFKRRSLCDLTGDIIFTEHDGKMNHEAWAKAKESQPTKELAFFDYDGESNMAICSIEEWEWTFGTSWCQWLKWFRKPFIKKTLELSFAKETGAKKGSWKGGCTGSSIVMMPDESINSAFNRYCLKNKFTLEFNSNDAITARS